jgi:hypothetical protein
MRPIPRRAVAPPFAFARVFTGWLRNDIEIVALKPHPVCRLQRVGDKPELVCALAMAPSCGRKISFKSLKIVGWQTDLKPGPRYV